MKLYHIKTAFGSERITANPALTGSYPDTVINSFVVGKPFQIMREKETVSQSLKRTQVFDAVDINVVLALSRVQCFAPIT
jgi:hypothetical protein